MKPNKHMAVVRRALLLLPLAASPIAATTSGLEVVSTSGTAGAFEVRVDGVRWLSSDGAAGAAGLSISLDGLAGGARGTLPLLGAANRTAGSDRFGAFSSVSLSWGKQSGGAPTLTTDVRVYSGRQMAVFTQTWPGGWQPQSSHWHESPTPSERHTKPPLPPKPAMTVAAFPELNISRNVSADLSWLGWSGCQNSFPSHGSWGPAGEGAPRYDGVTGGVPLVLHDAKARTLVLSPLENFFVAAQGAENSSLQCGVRGTVKVRNCLLLSIS